MKQLLLYFLILLFTSVACSPAQAQPACAPTNGLVGYYPLNETQGTTAQEATGQFAAGQLTGGVWQPTGGHDGGGALFLTGATYLDIPLLWQPTTYSISFWIKPTTLYDWSQGTGAVAGWGAFLFHSTASGGIYVGTNGYSRIDLGSSNLVQRDVWQHFVFTFDNGTTALYKNGQLLAKQRGMALPQPWQGLRLGLSGEQAYDELRVYDRALTGQEASDLYQCPVAPQCPVQAAISPATATSQAGAATALHATTNVAGSALTFDGVDDYVSITDSHNPGVPALANVTNNFTMEAWVWPTASHEIDDPNYQYGGTSGQRYVVFPTHGGAFDNFGGNHVGAGFSVGTNGVSVYEHAADYMPAVLVYAHALSGWTHVAVVYESGAPTLYVNGVAVQKGPPSPRAYVHPSLGCGGGYYGYFSGRIDELRVWSRVRTAPEINADFGRTVASTTPGLVGYWRFDEASGTRTVDASAARNTGELVRGVTWQTATPAPVAAATIQWSPATNLSASTGPNVVARPSQTTTYTVVAAGPDGCGTAQATATLTVTGAAALPPDNPSENREHNWTLERSFDGEGNEVAASKQFVDGLGRPTQAQARNATTQQVFASQTVYNSGGQPVLQTLAAPTNNQSFNYKEGFITAGGQDYGPAQFEEARASDPTPVDAAAKGTLGYYFSQANAQEPLTPITSYPYSLVEPYDGPLGGTKRAAGPGDELRMGKGREAKGRDFPLRKEFDTYLTLRPQFVPGSPPATLEYQGLKSVSVNADGRESLVVTNKEGQAIISCLSGTQYPGLPVFGFISSEATNRFDARAPTYQDIHIPAAGAQDVKFTMGSEYTQGGRVRIVNLLTQDTTSYAVKPATAGVEPEKHVTLDPGFYRFVPVTGTIWSYYEAHYGNFSYTYYDDAGRVVATVAPKDFDVRPNGLSAPTAPAPTFVTRNTYDTSGRLLATASNDEGRSEYVYAQDGRIRFSQSALQRPAGRFSYSNYDEVGRVVESGEYTPGNLTFENHLTPTPAAASVLQTGLLEDRTRSGGLDVANCAQRNQVWYDLPWDGSAGSLGTDSPLNGRSQEFVLGAVAKTQNENVTTWYSYDELGRVSWVVQDIRGVGVKTLDYQYDFSGNVLAVAYQKGQPDSFYHTYGYDAAQRLTTVYTSPDGGRQTLQAAYSYYLHGPLKRVQVAGDLQGVDYTYTLQGALKAINHVNQTLEPGHDAPETNGVYKDLFALTLDYFSGDYRSRAIDAPALTAGGPSAPTRYDGTIQGAAWRTAASADLHRVAYTYDEQSQLQDSQYGRWERPRNSSSYLLNAASTAALREGGMSYDANGNMQSLQRTDQLGATTDNFSYSYKPSTNQLAAVHTGSASGATVLDYDYDALGQMTRQRDEQGQRYFTYDVTGKTTGVYLDADHRQPLVAYAYDDRGFRVRQTVYPATGGAAHVTTYVRDVAGNLLALYEQATPSSPAVRSEVPLYGASRLGTLAHLADGRDDYRYELSDHLGDARVVFHRPTTEILVETMELGGVSPQAAFQNDDLYRVPVRGAPSGQFVARLTNSQPVGQELKRVLPVTQGDTITFSALALWQQNAAANGSSATPYVLTGALAAGANGFSQRGADGQPQPPHVGPLAWLSQLAVGLGFTLGTHGAPQQLGATSLTGWLKYRVLDAQGNEVSTGRDYVFGSGKWEYLQTGVRVPQDGTLEVMAGTSGSGEAVYFDNLRVEQTGGLIVQEQHQYAYGAPLPGLSYTVGNRRYRHGYQGQYAEHDSLTGFDSFELRLYNSRVGRWMSFDPEGQYSSPYTGMGNNPANQVDPDGGWAWFGAATGTVVGGAIGGAISSANGGSFWKGAAIGAAAGFVGGGLLGPELNSTGNYAKPGNTLYSLSWDNSFSFLQGGGRGSSVAPLSPNQVGLNISPSNFSLPSSLDAIAPSLNEVVIIGHRSAALPLGAAAVKAAASTVQPQSFGGHSYLDRALQYAGVPYVWGGMSSQGTDCSGLIQLGVGLSHRVWSTRAPGNPAPPGAWNHVYPRTQSTQSFLADVYRGDLFVWYGSHTAFYLGGGSIFHGPSKGQVVKQTNDLVGYWLRTHGFPSVFRQK